MAYQSNMMNNPQNPNWRGTSPFLGSVPRRSSRISSKYRSATPAPATPTSAPAASSSVAAPSSGMTSPQPTPSASPVSGQRTSAPWKEWFNNTPEMVARRQPGFIGTTEVKPWQGLNGDTFMRERWERANPEAAREYYRSNPRMRPATPQLGLEILGPGYYTGGGTMAGLIRPGASSVAGMMPVRRQALDRIAGSTVKLPRMM